MLISYGRPSIAWTITGGTFITDSAALTNGRPADVTRIQWPSGTQTTATTVTLTGALGAAISPRCAGLILPNKATAVPTNVKVTVSGKMSGAAVNLNGNSLTQRTVTLPTGATVAWFIFPRGTPTIDTIIFTIYNDKGGATWAAASQFVDLGENWIGKGADFAVARDPEGTLEGGVMQRQSRNNQAQPLAREQPYRVDTFNLQAMTEIQAIGPNSNQDDFETVRAQLTTTSAYVLIPMYLKEGSAYTSDFLPVTVDATTISAQRLQRSARIGVTDSPIKLGGKDKYYVSPITHQETPP